MDTTRKKREIDLLNVIFCLIVVFIHVTSEPISRLDHSSAKYYILLAPHRLATFVMQGFILLSAVKAVLKYRDRPFHYGKFLISRFKAIIIPYIIWTVVYYLYFISIGYFQFELSALLKYLAVGNIVSPFYFIITITQFYLLMPLWIAMIRRVHSIPAIITSVFVSVICNEWLPNTLSLLFGIDFKYNDRFFTTYLIYWVIGCYIGANYEKFIELITRNRMYLSITYGITAIVEYIFWALAQGKGIRAGFLENLHMFYTVATITFLFYAALKTSEWLFAKIPLLKYINAASYPIFIVHCLVMGIVTRQLDKLPPMDMLLRYGIRLAAVYGISLGLCIGYNLIKNRIMSALKPKKL